MQVALAHTIGHVAATVSMSKVAVSFTHIIKSAEPAFSVIISKLVFGENYPLPVYLSLLPIIGGCGLAAATELNFNMTGNPLHPISILSLTFSGPGVCLYGVSNNLCRFPTSIEVVLYLVYDIRLILEVSQRGTKVGV
jgi:hypothetical protein